jgi:phosphatidylserine decarboxylase
MNLVSLKGDKKVDNYVPFSHKVGLHMTRFLPVKGLLKRITNKCEKWREDSKPEDIEDFIDQYKIDWKKSKKCIDSPSKKDCAKKFRSRNEFFQREIDVVIENINDPEAFVSPAECRIVGFESVDESKKIWVKGEKFTIPSLFKNDVYNFYEKGSMIIFRLAPQDYHRFYMPVDCIYMGNYRVNGEYFSVNPIAVNNMDVYTENKREVHFLFSEKFGNIAYVIIGATCAGSIEIESDIVEGNFYKKGHLLGKFGFGGSTIIVFFEKDRANIDDRILKNSRNKIETYCLVGETICNAKNPGKVKLEFKD